jgi:hypothetical protein
MCLCLHVLAHAGLCWAACQALTNPFPEVRTRLLAMLCTFLDALRDDARPAALAGLVAKCAVELTTSHMAVAGLDDLPYAVALIKHFVDDPVARGRLSDGDAQDQMMKWIGKVLPEVRDGGPGCHLRGGAGSRKERGRKRRPGAAGL